MLNESGETQIANGKAIVINQVDQWDLDRAINGGEKIVNGAAFLNPVDRRTGHFILPDELLRTYTQHEQVYDLLVQNGKGRIRDLKTRRDIDEILITSEMGLIRSTEGVYGRFDLNDIDIMVNRGVKIWCFMWNFDNPDTGKAAATTGTPEDTGLTLKGKEFIRHLAVVRRVAVDLSHTSDQTAYNVLDIIAAESGVPAVATHSGSRKIKDHKRNLTDEIALRIAEQDGFIGIPIGVKTFVGNIKGAVDHIEHFASLDPNMIWHLTLGPDWDGIVSTSLIADAKDPETAYKNLGTEMLRRGFSLKHIDAVMFDNALRYNQKYLFPS